MCRPYKASKSLLDLSLYLQGSAFPGYPEASKWSQSPPSSLPNGSSQPMRKPGCNVSPTGQAEQGNSLLVSSTSVFQQHYVQLTTHQWHRSLVTLIKKIHNPNPTFNCCTERNQPPGPLIQAELSEAPNEKKTRLRLWKLVPEVPIPRSVTLDGRFLINKRWHTHFDDTITNTKVFWKHKA